jgi:hypothetical protein
MMQASEMILRVLPDLRVIELVAFPAAPSASGADHSRGP